MTGGILQLVAYGKQDIYLTHNPQITFFKIIYRRYSNFSREDINQNFSHEPNFGKRASCVISRDTGDLIDKMALKVVLPQIPVLSYSGMPIKFAWVKNIGFAMIKYIEIEINGIVIDKHYSDWMYIWSQLTTRNDNGLNKLIGNVPELYNFSNYKDEYTLYIPLYFWFCRSPGLAIPLISLKFSDIKINIEFYEFEKCCIINPTYYITCSNDIVNFQENEHIYQQNIHCIFSHYDIITKRLYYTPLNEVFISCSIHERPHIKYLIKNAFGFTASPEVDALSTIVHHKSLKNLKLKDASMLVGYVYIDNDERHKYARAKHDYLIEQLYYTPNIKITNTHAKVLLNIEHPCKMIVWMGQKNNVFDRFDYTDMYGNPLITDCSILLNSQNRVSTRPYQYFNNIQSIQHTNNILPVGCCMYSFALSPCDTQPSGTTNMSQIEMIELHLKTITHNINFKSYALCYNILRIDNGLCGKLFIN
jgi:hypothetical protein